MSLRDALTHCDMEMDADDVEAFCIGALTADEPMPLHKALKEIFLDDTQSPVKFHTPDGRANAEKEIGKLWKELEKNLAKRRSALMQVKGVDLKEEVITLGKRGDFFLMGLTLAGMSVDDTEDEVGDLLDELEDHLLLLDEWVAEGDDDNSGEWMENGKKYRRELEELWADLQEAIDPS
jgi:hypothetical protein